MLTLVVIARNKRFPKGVHDFLLLPKTFGVEESMHLDFAIKSDIAEAVNASRQIYDFCNAQGIDNKRKHHLALCIEEMTVNVVKHAFSDDKTHIIEIRILRKGDDLIFRLRDEGKPFNPLSVPMGKDVELGKNVSIHIIRSISKSVDYRFTVGLNNLLVKI